jgi:hypothetical protein
VKVWGTGRWYDPICKAHCIMLHRTTNANLWLGNSHYKCKKFYNVNVLHCCRLRYIALNSVNHSLRRSSTYHIHCRMTTFCILSYYWMSFIYLEQSWIPNHQAIVSLLESFFSMLYVDQGLLILFQNQLRFKAPEMVLMNNFPWLNKLHEASKLAMALRHAILRESGSRTISQNFQLSRIFSHHGIVDHTILQEK